jgi:hypothetical protein
MNTRISKKISVILTSIIVSVVIIGTSSIHSFAQSNVGTTLNTLQTYAATKEYSKAAHYLYSMYKDGGLFELGVDSGAPAIRDNKDGTGCGLYQGVDRFPNGKPVIYFYYGGMTGGVRTGSGVIISWSWNSDGYENGYYSFEGEFADDLPNGTGTATEVVYYLYTNITTGTYTNGLEDGVMVESQIKEVLEEFEYRDLTYTSVGGVRQDKTQEVADHIYKQIEDYGVEASCTKEEILNELRTWSSLQGGYIYMYDPNYTNVCNHGFGFDEEDSPFCNYEWCVWTTSGSTEGVRHIVS